MPIPRRRAPLTDPEVSAGLDTIFLEQDIEASFSDEVTTAAESQVAADAGTKSRRTDRRDLPFVTVDPVGSTDLDQALAIEATPGGGHIVWYAIADVMAFVPPGGPVDAESHRRGVTLYAPGRRVPLHPPSISEGAASLLAGQDRPAVLWRLQLDADGSLVDTTVGRAVVRSREQLDYATAQRRIDEGDEVLAPLAVVGRRREVIETDRGGLNLPVPEQEVEHGADGYRLVYRAQLPVEGWNAQLSLLCGMAAAQLMLEGGWGLLRTLPPADGPALALLRRHAKALGVVWTTEQGYADVVRGLDAGDPGDAAFAVQATRLFRGADYLPLRPGVDVSDEVMIHAAIAAPYAHVTAPLRRLGDRFATECVLATVAGETPPEGVRAVLDDLPAELRSGASRAGTLDRAVVDLFESLVLSTVSRDETFDGVVVDHRSSGSVVQLHDPAVVATVDVELPLGEQVSVRVDDADPVARRVALSVVD
ncbi:RNB domain-containing ribonuclease [Actinospongicola halichondriae]|uniref:RNB domain-containing ribonuclease n=1 Tax=Actinospongicola halichondriae TaxID=3236844 RepID=UPI003D57D4BB